MASNTSGPSKPWEGVPNTSGPSPFRPSSSAYSTAAVVESSGLAERHATKYPQTNVACHNGTITGRPMPPRPWERNLTNSYGGPHGTNTYYDGRMGNQYNGGGYGSAGSYGGVGMYRGQGLGTLYCGGAGIHGSGYGGMYGGAYGMGMGTPAMFGGDPNGLGGGPPPSGPPSFWQSVLKALFDRAGLLYGELARFVMRLLGIHTKPKSQTKVQELPQATSEESESVTLDPKEIGNSAWDHVWLEKDVQKCD